MKPQETRQSFVDFFVQRGHLHYKSASLVPEAFSTTLFTIAGMEQFVPVFLGDEDPPAQNAVTVQRCLRVAGGKNDLENVGRSGRHGTLLEMLGNFSFGGYYKREAIVWAWEYLTGVLRLPPDRLYATVYTDDDEAEDIWKRDVGLAADRVSRFREDNFWDMGPTGPCGPCSEIFYDLGASVGCGRDDCKVGCSHCNRYIELWNLVFQQYDRDAGGELHPLPRKCIDTGMGFERLCMVMAGATSIFETDLYQSIIRRLPTSRKTCPLPESEQIVHKNIIADHGRAAVFLAADGVVPSNTDRGYVMRFLIRRAIRSGKLLYLPDSFLSNLVPTIVASLSDWYPELAREQEKAADLIRFEEKAFSSTIQRATDILADQVAALKGRHQRIPGDLAFKLHDTYGLPPELQMEIVRDFGFSEGIDMEGYRAAMDEQRERARRDAQKKRAEVRVVSSQTVDLPDSDFVGYEQLETTARIAAIYDLKGNAINSIEQGQEAMLLLDRTPFYA